MRLRIGLWTGAALLWGASTATWEMSGYQEFIRGRFAGVSLSRDGELMLAPRLETVVASDQPVIWSLVRAADGTVYAGTGHGGRVLKVDPTGRSSVLWTADQPEVFALALGPDGLLYAGTSPNGKVYRINARGEATEFFAPQTTYIWALTFDRSGALYVGTGDQGKIFRVEPSGKGEVYYETGQIHVTCLGWDAAGRLVAGTDPNGILYRITEKDKGFVLYDANLPEIRSVALGPDGALYAAALGGAMLRRTPAVPPSASGGQGPPATAPATVTVTVSEELAQGGVEIKPKPEAAKPAPPAVTLPAPAPVVDLAGVEKAAVFRIGPDLTVETLWTSKEENVYDLAPVGEDLIFATDGRGRLYRLGRDRKVTLLAQTNESEATRLAVSASGLLAATGNLGKIFRLSDEYATAGEYESPVHDAGSVARWGRISWRAEAGQHGKILLRTRTGNSARPDRTWSEWSEPLTDASGSLIPSPNARYIQWKAEFFGNGKSSPVLRSVTVAYLPQNTPPAVKSITVSAVAAAGAAPQKAAGAAAPSSTYSITVTDTGEPPAPTSSGTPAQALGRAGAGQLQIGWQAEDPDGDRLTYAVYFRGEDERQWKLIRDNLMEASVQIDREALADGRYFFRVVASDQAANPPGTARQAELVSAPVLIDNTPPKVRLGAPRRVGTDLEIEVEATDEVSPLRRAEFSLDAGPWTPLAAEDGVADSPRERFRLRVVSPPPGEHVLVVRVYDAADNAGLAKIVLP
ncbi:MAG: hypothetical protein RMK57_13905 [Bryobacterales bacterium]|nr:hypothetical protein [Bryobacteraceae bacterium]MDW8355614.1 hypothetical protein [Bryobacterales bacterium]